MHFLEWKCLNASFGLNGLRGESTGVWWILHYWPFVRGMHWCPVDSLHKEPIMHSVFQSSFNNSFCIAKHYVNPLMIYCDMPAFEAQLGQLWVAVMRNVQETDHVIMMASNGSILCVTVPLCGESTALRWIPCTMDCNADLWCFFVVSLSKLLNKHLIDQ